MSGGPRNYGRKASTPFERLINQQCQKGVSASKSAGVVGRWGVTSFTSLRNGDYSGPSAASASGEPPKKKKFFKSRNVVPDPPPIQPDISRREVTDYNAEITPIVEQQPQQQPQQQRTKPNKFFTSKRNHITPAAVKPVIKPPPPPPPPASKPVLALSSKPVSYSDRSLRPSRNPAIVEYDEDDSNLFESSLQESQINTPLEGQAETPSSSVTDEEDEEEEAEGEIEDDNDNNFEVEEKKESKEEKVPPLKLKLSLASRSQLEMPSKYKLVKSFSGSDDSEDSLKSASASVEAESTVESESIVEESSNDTVIPLSTREAPTPPPASTAAVPEVRTPTPPPIPSTANSYYSSSNSSRSNSRFTLPEVEPEIEKPLLCNRIRTYTRKRQQQQPTSTGIELSKEEEKVESKTDETIPDIPEKVDILPPPPPSSASSSSSTSVPEVKSEMPVEEEEKSERDLAPPSSPVLLKKANSVASSADVHRELSSSSSSSDRKSSSQDLPSQAAPPTKKKSIFKSKDKTRKAHYKHKWNASSTDELKQEVLTRALTGPLPSSCLDFGSDDFGPPPSDISFSTKLIRVPSTTISGSSSSSSAMFDDNEAAGGVTRNPALLDTTTAVTTTAVKCPKSQKEYFTVIKNVKKAHQIQDSGEFQEFNDDVEYILGGLGAKHSLSTRCLSTITLASKCMEPPFRMHLRAHGTVTSFFRELKDAPQNPSLALCVSTVLFVLSQDRLNMDLDRDSLELMLNLLDTDSRIRDALDGSGMDERELEKNKQKVRDLCAAMKSKGHAKNLSLDNISADHLSMETLLSLTSKRAGEWFKEELRELGGLDQLIRTLSDCVSFLLADEISIWTEPLLNKLRKADRVLKVLENVTHENEENCHYLLDYHDGQFLALIHSLFKLLDEEVPLHPNLDHNDKESTAYALSEALMDLIRVYINLVHDYHSTPFGSKLSGEKEGIFDMALHCLIVIPEYIPVNKRFDILVLTLTLIINLVENCMDNRKRLMKIQAPQKADNLFSSKGQISGVEGLVNLFLEKEASARNEESKTDNILDGVKVEDDDDDPKPKDDQKKSKEEVIDETVAKLLHKAGRHMEDTLIASYITLIIGYLILDNTDNEKSIREFLPDRNYVLMVSILKKFFNFMNLTASASIASSRGIKQTEKIIKYLEKIDKPPEPEVKPEPEEEVEEEEDDDITLFDVSKEETLMDDDFGGIGKP